VTSKAGIVAANREKFRAILAGTRCVRPIPVYDPLSARLVEEMGFELGMIPGSDSALAVLGAPDIALITMTEFVEQVHRITRAAAIPFLADGDHGYGNALNAARMVSELDTVGLCAVTIEDTQLPAVFGGNGNRMVPIPEAVGKLRAAVAARGDSRFCVIGRTSNNMAANFDETLARVKAYEATGVDGIFVGGIETREQLDALAGATQCPFVLPAPHDAINDDDYLASRRVRVAFHKVKPISAAITAMHDLLATLTPPRGPIGGSKQDLFRRLTRADAYDAAVKSYLNE
jgi:carboxyvinyl-carboxyphosphonate phosphorylmutase